MTIEYDAAENAKLAEWIIQQSSDALIYSDRFGKIRRWNAAAAHLFGYTENDAIGASLDLIIPERLRAAHWAGFEAAMTSGRTRLDGKPTLTRALHVSGRKLYVEMTFAVVKDDTGTAIGSVAMARDVTEKVENERAEKAARR